MIPDYLVVGGVEIVNAARAFAYSGGDDPDTCGDLLATCYDCPPGTDLWLNDGKPYEGVAADPAPWYDDAIPESIGVTGITGLRVKGLDSARYADPGGDNRSAQGAVRDIEFTVLMSARDECALSYGMGWLAAALGPPVCGGGGCIGQQACMLACCPDITDPDTGQASNDPIRSLFDVVTVDGPTIDGDPHYGGTSIVAEITFTLRTTNTGIFRNPGNLMWDFSPATGSAVTVDLPAIYEACVEPPDCSVDPDCIPPPLADLPAPPVDPCYPSDPFEAWRSVIRVNSRFVSDNLDIVPVVTAVAGTTEIRNLTVRFYLNPFGASCFELDELNPCRACADLTVAYIPPRGVLELDGRTGRALITCRSELGVSTHVPTVYGPAGGAGVFPSIACGPGLCIETYVAQTTGIDARVKIELYPRQLAG